MSRKRVIDLQVPEKCHLDLDFFCILRGHSEDNYLEDFRLGKHARKMWDHAYQAGYDQAKREIREALGVEER